MGPLQNNLFPTPGLPAFFECIEKITDDGSFYNHPCVTPTPASPPEMKPTVFIGNVKPTGEGLFQIDHNKLSMISMNIMKGGRPFKGTGSSDLNTLQSHLFPKISRSSKGSKVVI